MLAPSAQTDKRHGAILFQVPAHFVYDPVAVEYHAFFRFARLGGLPRTG